MPAKITNEKAKIKLSINNKNIVFVNEYYNSREKSKFKCLICNYEWEANAKNVINGYSGCPECGKIKSKNTIKHNISTEMFIEKVRKKHGNKINVIGNYINGNTRIEVECNVCGKKWNPKALYLIAGNGCYDCGHKEKAKKHLKSHENFIKEINCVHDGRIIVLGKYQNGKKKINVRCSICGHEWMPVAQRLLRRGCPNCHISKGELLINKLLKELSINFETHYVFQNLKTEDGGVPIFDFVIFNNYNKIEKIIEYDGEQHFKPIKKWGGEKRLEQQKKIDEFKNEFCLKNKIKIIRIPYTEFKKIDKEYIKKMIYE